MRIAIGLGILTALFVAGLVFDRHMDRELREERQRAGAAVELELLGPAAPPGTENGWSWLLLGRPSGREPPPRRAPPVVSAPALTAGAAAPAAPPAAGAGRSGAAQPEVRGVPRYVGRGETLHGIVRAHYGRAPAELVSWVARHNGLADPSKLRAGELVWLPNAPAKLGPR